MALNVRARLRKRKRAPQHIITIASAVRVMIEINAEREWECERWRRMKECQSGRKTTVHQFIALFQFPRLSFLIQFFEV